MQYIAIVYIGMQRYDEAGKLQRKALKIYQRSYGGDHQEIAMLLQQMGGSLLEQNKPGEALEKFDEALAMFMRTVGAYHVDVAGAYYNIARNKVKLWDFGAAVESLRESVRIYSRLGITEGNALKAAGMLKGQAQGGQVMGIE